MTTPPAITVGHWVTGVGAVWGGDAEAEGHGGYSASEGCPESEEPEQDVEDSPLGRVGGETHLLFNIEVRSKEEE